MTPHVRIRAASLECGKNALVWWRPGYSVGEKEKENAGVALASLDVVAIPGVLGRECLNNRCEHGRR